MEIHRMHRAFQHGHLGEEKQQMLSLNRRLETYLSRVKMLEEENALLAKEIQATRCSRGRDSARRKGLEEELRRARLEVDAAWRERVTVELEVGRLAEELQALDSLRQREAQAQAQAKATLEKSRKELEEEHRAQIWLKEKVSQLEMEIGLLVQSHRDDVAHLDSAMTRSKAAAGPPAVSQRGKPGLDLLQMGEEYTQRASWACQQTAEAYQGKLEHLEETLEQTRRRLVEAGQEKGSSLLQLGALEKEMASAQEVKAHLETTAMQARDRHSQDIHTLQEHLESLEEEKEELGQHIDYVVMENQGLLQLKMSLGLEVATYRALLDGESYRGDMSLRQQRNVLNTDAFFSHTGLSKNKQPHLSAAHKNTSLSFGCGTTEISQTATVNRAYTLRRRPVIFIETSKHGVEDATKLSSTPYPKILQDGAIESFRPQEVQETVTYAEPLSPPNELEILDENLAGDKDKKQDWTNQDQVAESDASYQVQSDLSNLRPLSEEISCDKIPQKLAQYNSRMAEGLCASLDETDREEPFKISEDLELKQPSAQIHTWVEKECLVEKMEQMQEETSDSETEALLEPTFESRTSSLASECEPTESVFNQASGFSHDDGVFQEDTAEMSQEVISLKAGIEKTDAEDKLYPDGEEMDTWDSVMERKVDLKGDVGMRKDEAEQQYAEPEEDISMRKPDHGKIESQQGDCPPTDKRENDKEEVPQLDEEEENDEEEDSQNVSVSWRTELESDSYAQDNTLADTRPLIRYKSDETEANTQASHMDESESSEGESERKVGETGAWGESQSKKFGTMEDLCEEVEEEALEGFDVGYPDHDEVNHGLTLAEKEEECLDEEKRGKPADEVCDEELDIDRLVEQELENLSTDSYSVHFSKQQPGESDAAVLRQDQDSNVIPCTGSDQLGSSTQVKSHDSLCFGTLREVMPQTDTLLDGEPEDEDQESADASEKWGEKCEHNVSMLTHADAAEDSLSEFISRPQMEELTSSHKFIQHEENMQNVLTEDMEAKPLVSPDVSQEEVVEDTQGCPDVPETAEWEVLQNPSEDFEAHHHMHMEVLENPSEDFEVHHHMDVLENTREDFEVRRHRDVLENSSVHHDKEPGTITEGSMTHEEEPPGFSPESLTEESNIFMVKDSSELSGKDSSLHGLLSDFWVSSLETGATFQPDDEAPEDQNLGFGNSLAWTDSGNVTMVNRNSRVDVDSSDTQVPKVDKEQKLTDVMQVFGRNATERVHSEDSDAEGASWSSGEE